MATTRKYADIVDWAIQQMATGVFQPNQRFLSEAALGERFDCSRQTVRRALEVLEQRGHVTRQQGRGTYVSASPRTGVSPRGAHESSTMTVGMVSTYMDSYIFPGIMRGIEGVLATEGYALHLTSTRNLVAGETRALQSMLSRRLDGLIIEPTRSALPCANLDLYRTITQRAIPVVCIDSYYPELTIPVVALDDEKAGYVATQHLLSMRHRKIACVFPHSHRQGHLRYLGYVKAHSELGIPIREERVFWYARESLSQVLKSSQFLEGLAATTALLCYNDQTAVTVMDTLRQSGRRVPEDISVVGIDNTELARVCSLTSVVHPAERVGEAAARLLLSMIGGSTGASMLFAPELVVRTSVRRLES